MKKPNIYPHDEVPGARSHYDDFSALHIKEAPFIHFNVRIT